MNWCERKVMERVSMFLSNDGVFLKSICPNPATYPNEAAAIFHSGVSNAPAAFDGPTGRVSLPIALRTNAIEWSGMVPTMPIPFADVVDINVNGAPLRSKDDISYRRPLTNRRKIHIP